MKTEKEIRKLRDDVRKINNVTKVCGCFTCITVSNQWIAVEKILTWLLDEDATGHMDRVIEGMSKEASELHT